MTQVNCDLWSCGGSAGHQRAAALERPHALVPGRGAHVLDHNVDAFLIRDLPNFLGNLLLVVVDAEISAQFFPLCQLGFIPGRRDHPTAEELCDLNRRDADAGTRSEHQHGLPGAHAGTSDQHVPGCDEHQGHARRLNEIERVGYRDRARGRDGDQLTIPSVHAIAENGEGATLILQALNTLLTVPAEMHRGHQYSLTCLESADILTDFRYFAGYVAPQNVRQFHSGQPLAYPYIQMIQRARSHANHYLVLA